jgi:hypothetical protein
MLAAPASGQMQTPPWAQDPPALQPLIAFAQTQSELRSAVEAYSSGRNALRRRVNAPNADTPKAENEQKIWYNTWLAELRRLDLERLSVEGKIDYVLLRNQVEYELALLATPRAARRSDPIGAEGLKAHLAHEMIPYTAEELIAIANREFQYLEQELLKTSRAMGYGDDWRAAQEAVKRKAVPPGEKPGVVVELARQSEEFIDARNAVTIPPLAREIWRMGMLSPERQLTSPFFLGGEQILISYPTDEMSHEDKLMSMRGNNPHFNRATVHHELIPGHHLQGFMNQRFNPHRGAFGTPFWTEGWALYWEIVLWEENFPRNNEDRIGMLFWRMHRAARIVFSLSYHLGTMTEAEAVDFLVNRVGHERANAAAEVRRSFEGSYPPLYQVAYLMGGIQFRALRRELVESGRMSERDFHDAILQGGTMPVELVRARLLGGRELTRDYTTKWRFAGDPLRNP